jgi:hypothetical protein
MDSGYCLGWDGKRLLPTRKFLPIYIRQTVTCHGYSFFELVKFLLCAENFAGVTSHRRGRAGVTILNHNTWQRCDCVNSWYGVDTIWYAAAVISQSHSM